MVPTYVELYGELLQNFVENILTLLNFVERFLHMAQSVKHLIAV